MKNKEFDRKTEKLFDRIQSLSGALLLPSDDDQYIPIRQHVKSSFAGDIPQANYMSNAFVRNDAYKAMVNSRLGR